MMLLLVSSLSFFQLPYILKLDPSSSPVLGLRRLSILVSAPYTPLMLQSKGLPTTKKRKIRRNKFKIYQFFVSSSLLEIFSLDITLLLFYWLTYLFLNLFLRTFDELSRRQNQNQKTGWSKKVILWLYDEIVEDTVFLINTPEMWKKQLVLS